MGRFWTIGSQMLTFCDAESLHSQFSFGGFHQLAGVTLTGLFHCHSPAPVLHYPGGSSGESVGASGLQVEEMEIEAPAFDDQPIPEYTIHPLYF